MITRKQLKEKGIKLDFLLKKLGMSKPTYYRRNERNDWRVGEVKILKELELWKD